MYFFTHTLHFTSALGRAGAEATQSCVSDVGPNHFKTTVGGGHDRVGGGTTNNASDDDDEVCQYSFVRATPAHDEGNPLRCGTRCGSTSHPSWTANARTAPNAVLWQDFDFPRTPLVTRAEQIHLALRKWLRTETD